MRYLTRLFSIVVIELLIFGCMQHEDTPSYVLQVGNVLPDFGTIKDNTGKVISSEVLKRKICLIVFVNTSCSDCQKELTELQEVYEQVHADVQCIVIGRSEPRESMDKYWVDNGLTIPYSAQDNDFVFRKFASAGIPRIFITNILGNVTFTSGDQYFVSSEILLEELDGLRYVYGKN